MAEQNNDGGGAALMAAWGAFKVWDVCTYTGLAIGGPAGLMVGWCVGAGLVALGVGAVIKHSNSETKE